MSPLAQQASEPSWSCWPIPLSSQGLESYALALGLSPEDALPGLARAIATSPGWPEEPAVSLLVRWRAEPLLAVFGVVDARTAGWIEAQARTLESTCRRLRYFNHCAAEEASEELAARLLAHLGPDQIREARFLAVPRGGLIVLGLLASILGLRREQLEPPHPEECLLVAVDDCALSGTRCIEILRRHPQARILFAHLASHPTLRSSLQALDPRVAGCLASRDLTGDAATVPAGLERVWTAHLEPIGFPWNEPDRSIWNPVAERWERGWRIIPPELCLKNRPASGSRSVPIHVQAETQGGFRAAERVLCAEFGGEIALFDLENRCRFSFAGTGADLWRTLLRCDGVEAAVAELTRNYDVSEEALRKDLLRFSEELLTRGLLEIHPMAGASAPVPC